MSRLQTSERGQSDDSWPDGINLAVSMSAIPACHSSLCHSSKTGSIHFLEWMITGCLGFCLKHINQIELRAFMPHHCQSCSDLSTVVRSMVKHMS